MSRLSRRDRTYKDIGFKNKGGLADLCDNGFKMTFRINDEEYDYIIGQLSPEEMDILVTINLSFNEKRKCLEILAKYLAQFYDSRS